MASKGYKVNATAEWLLKANGHKLKVANIICRRVLFERLCGGESRNVLFIKPGLCVKSADKAEDVIVRCVEGFARAEDVIVRCVEGFARAEDAIVRCVEGFVRAEDAFI